MDSPGNFVGMGFDYDLEFCLGVDNGCNGAISIHLIGIAIRLDIVQPDFLPTGLVTDR